MPELSRFFGIVVFMEYRDHDPPHFHAAHGEHEARITIDTGTVTGFLPKRALRRVEQWRRLHLDELAENWRLARERRPLKPITPLE